MKPTRRIATALTLVALTACGSISAGAGGRAAQDDPFTQLKSYDFQNRAPVEAIRAMIQEAYPDTEKTAQIEQNLDGVLQDPKATFAGKQEACRLLWIVGSARSVPVLAKMLPDKKLSDMARYALERDTAPAAGQALRAALAKTKGATLLGIINSIGDRADADAVSNLKPFTTATDPRVSEAAIAALGKIGTPDSLIVLRALPADNLTAGKAMFRCAQRFAAEGKKADAERVCEDLAGTGRSDLLRAEAVRELAALRSPRASALALSALKSSDPYLQQVAARVCGSLPDRQTTGRCLAAWPALPASTQTILLTALADRREPAATQIALNATKSQNPALRVAAIQCAARVGGAKVVPRLAEIAVRGEEADRNAARESLANMPGAGAEQAILHLARQGQPETRAALMSVLADRPTPGAIVVLLEAAHGDDTRVAVEALKTLGRVGGAQEVPELVKLTATAQTDDVRDAAKDAVVAVAQRLDDREHTADLALAELPGAAPAGKAALLQALAQLGGNSALDALTQAASSDQPEVKQAAVASLAETWSDTRPLPTLLIVAKSDANKSLRVQALRGYLRLIGQDDRMPAEDKVERVGEALAVAERPEEKRQALGILRDCRTDSSMALTAKLLNEPDVFPDAADTVLYLAAPQKKGNTPQPAVTGRATTAALNKVIRLTKDDNQRAQAQQLR